MFTLAHLSDPHLAPLPTPPGTETVRGTFTRIECDQRTLLVLIVNEKTVKLHSRTPNSIRFTTSDPSLNAIVGCGPLPRGGVPATITYRPEQSADSIGEVLAVDLGEED